MWAWNYEVVDLVKRSIQYSFIDDDAKADLLATFDAEIEAAKVRYLEPNSEPTES